jgi:molecular chaperone GrpE (heat shock protein)
VLGHLARLAAQADRMQARLDMLWAELRASSGQITALTRHLTGPDVNRPLDERLADLLTRLETGQQQLEELAQTVARLGRTQFRANALSEAKKQQIAAALTTLQEIAAHRERLQEAHTWEEQQRLAELRAEARGELAADLLPALDGLELALETGHALLERRRQAATVPARQRARSHNFVWHRLRQALTSALSRVGVGETTPTTPPSTSEPPPDEAAEALDGWLRGLELVRERFLGLLAAEGIQPIPALHRSFDPRLHLARAAEPRGDVPPGTVITVQRKGYRQRERVLRYAEVVVSRALEEPAVAPTPAPPQPAPASPHREVAAGSPFGPGVRVSEELPDQPTIHLLRSEQAPPHRAEEAAATPHVVDNGGQPDCGLRTEEENHESTTENPGD